MTISHRLHCCCPVPQCHPFFLNHFPTDSCWVSQPLPSPLWLILCRCQGGVSAPAYLGANQLLPSCCQRSHPLSPATPSPHLQPNRLPPCSSNTCTGPGCRLLPSLVLLFATVSSLTDRWAHSHFIQAFLQMSSPSKGPAGLPVSMAPSHCVLPSVSWCL